MIANLTQEISDRVYQINGNIIRVIDAIRKINCTCSGGGSSGLSVSMCNCLTYAADHGHLGDMPVECYRQVFTACGSKNYAGLNNNRNQFSRRNDINH